MRRRAVDRITPDKIYSSNPSFVSRVWIDASDYAVGAISNGATITNKFNSSLNFTVVGSGLSVQVNSDGYKEFVFDGTTFLQCADQNNFIDLHLENVESTVFFVGKVGTSSNPDALYGLCGNNGGSSVSIGMCVLVENRVAQPATHGWRLFVTKGVSNDSPFSSIWNEATFNTRQCVVIHHNAELNIDNDRLFIDGESYGIKDRSRSTANTGSGLGTPRTFSSSNPTYKFEIGSGGNGTVKLVGKMEQFVLLVGLPSVAGVVEFTKGLYVKPLRGNTLHIPLKIHQTITNGYILGGTYAKNADKSKTIFVSSTGPNHFTAGSDREGCITVSIDDGYNFPAFSTIWSDASNAVHGGVSGGYTETGRLVVAYGRYSSTTGTYNGLVVRYSDDDGATWSSENALTLPSTSPALTVYIAHDKLVTCDNGDIIIPWYAFSGTSLYKIYVMRSSDDGLTWSHNEIYTSGSVYYNETSVANLGGGYILAMSRVEAINGSSYEFRQSISSNHGVTWSSQGNTNLGQTLYVYAHPPMLRTFELNSELVVAMYYVNRGTRRWGVKYALASAIIASGTSVWSSAPTYTLDHGLAQYNTGGWVSGYPFVIHPDNDIKCEGVYFDETSSSVATVNFFKVGDDHAAAVATALGI